MVEFYPDFGSCFTFNSAFGKNGNASQEMRNAWMSGASSGEPNLLI
jgi:hypothetical protein